MKSKAKSRAAFYKIRGSYLPSNPRGLAIYFIYMAYIIALPVAWYRHGHDLFVLLVVVVPLLALAALLTQFIASKNTK